MRRMRRVRIMPSQLQERPRFRIFNSLVQLKRLYFFNASRIGNTGTDNNVAIIGGGRHWGKTHSSHSDAQEKDYFFYKTFHSTSIPQVKVSVAS